MSTVADVSEFLKQLAPLTLAEDWDNTDLLLGRSGAVVTKVLTCLTLTPDVADEAVEQGVQLVVSHHPVLFRGTKRLTDATTEGRMLLTLVENGVAVYSPHTAFDSAAGGVNEQLANSFGLTNLRPVRPSEDQSFAGGGRYGTLGQAAELGGFVAKVRDAVAGGYVEFSGALDARVSQVAVACGSAGEFLGDAVRLECDTFVTGEAQFHTALEARARGVNLILLGHYSSERPAVESLAQVLGEQFPEVETWASRRERDPLSVYPS